jgi:HlyD family secretion protein
MIATTMSSAVIGSGQFVVDGNVKKVQHPTGGVVSQLLVREGDQVSQGDLLIRLDETVTRANFQVVAGQLYELFGRKARLEAERDGRNAMDVPGELAGRTNDAEVERIVTSERRLFDARRAARESQRAQFTKRIAQFQNEIVGFRAQLDANARETQIITEELKGVRELFEKRLTPIMRLNGLERQAVNLTGQRGQLTAQIAQTEGKIGEIELQIARIDEDLRAETQKELREIQGKIAELTERRVAADDNLKRVELRAPSSGTVHQLTVHTVGGVLSPGEPAMLIIPSSEELIVEAKVTPQDRDQLQIGQHVTVRVHSSNQRNTPEINGTLTRIAADVSKDTPGSLPFYPVGVTVAKSELERLRGVHIAAGMQADVLIEVGSRSPLSYLLRPLSDQAAKAFRER